MKIKTYSCKNCWKQEYSKEALSWNDFNPKGIIRFPYDDKQVNVLRSMRNNSPESQYSGKKKIPKHSTTWEK